MELYTVNSFQNQAKPSMSDSMKDDPSVIKVRGLPYDTSPIDLCRFFKDCDINGGPNGEYEHLTGLVLNTSCRHLFLSERPRPSDWRSLH